MREPEEAVQAVPGTSYRIVPLGSGPFEVATTTFRLGDMALQVGRSTPFLGFATPNPGMAVLQIPLAHAGTLLLNGMQAQRRMFGIYSEGSELLRASPRDSRYAALTLPRGNAEALLTPLGWAAPFRPGSHAYATATQEAWDRMARVVQTAERTATESPDIFENEQPRRALRHAVLDAGRELLASAVSEEGSSATVRIPRASRGRHRIVVAADAYLQAHLDHPIYTDELCDALGVSATALSEAFRAVFLVSPHRFLKYRRLHMVRAVLRDRDGPVPLVKSVALSHGFWHLGQFSHDYRAAFGETPSETLARARGLAVLEAGSVN
ncbi:helix-turn-helix domain-containing protein [Sabulicella rubraurantiaca]|uniref:helix-turn-helix domain-containing protein n=1 Tax=Sabulicella rubraurantiaca TaxID=2811429 RepID=UPI001A96438A|nr:AraC family transcriptional regulator [Sabulicella rubraurantiaca]